MTIIPYDSFIPDYRPYTIGSSVVVQLPRDFYDDDISPARGYTGKVLDRWVELLSQDNLDDTHRRTPEYVYLVDFRGISSYYDGAEELVVPDRYLTSERPDNSRG